MSSKPDEGQRLALHAARALLVFLGCVLPTVAAAEPAGQAAASPELVQDQRGAFDLGPVWFEQRVGFRFRPELLVGGDLGAGESAAPEPLAAGNGGGPGTLLWASMRLRYEPTIHIGSPWAIHAGIDVFSNLVLGSTHVNAGGDFAGGLWQHSAASPSTGHYAFRDALQLRYLYGSWRILEILDLAGGRMTDGFGLGVGRNDGDCPDCDHGTIFDGVRVGFSYGDFRIEGTWEVTAAGTTTDRPGFEGQAVGLGQADDVHTYTVRLFSAPLTDRQRETRRRLLDEERDWAFDWGVFSAFVDQKLSSSVQTTEDCAAYGSTLKGDVALPYDCAELVPRDVFFWRPSVWFRTEWHPEPRLALRIELEAGALYGTAENVQRLAEFGKIKRTFAGFGGALEAELRVDAVRTGLYSGFATGDDRGHFGYLDGQDIVVPVPDDELWVDEAYANTRHNRTVTSYWFDRDYRLDLILFRQVVGGVTNAFYVKPWVAGDLLDTADLRLTGRLDVLYAMALQVAGTPGRGRHLGVEIDAELGLELGGGVSLGLTAGILVPLDALSNAETGAAADPAFAMRGLFRLDL